MPNHYDILILGAGLGGLECGLILSRKGYSVCVLEKNEHIGGTLQDFRLGNCTFSAGMHYLGSLDEGQVLNRLFRYFGILPDLRLKRMDESLFDRFSIGGNTIDYPMGWERFRERMAEYFPHEKKAIDNYVALIRKVTDSQAIYNLREPGGYDIRTNPYLNTSVVEAIGSITPNKELQQALCALNFVYAGDRLTTSLYAHALINNYYIQSAYRLIGGSSQLAGSLAGQIRRAGGTIRTQQAAREMIFEGDRLKGVLTDTGEIFTADRIISNIHPAVTLDMIPEGKIRKSFRHRIGRMENSISVFGLHLRLKPGRFPYIPYNYYHFEDQDVWAVSNYDTDRWPGFYFLYTPASEGGDEFAACLSIYAYMRYDEVAHWAALPVSQRGEEYDTWKADQAEKLINAAARQFPVLKDCVSDWIAATPITYESYIGTPGGAMYGTVRDYRNPMASYVFPRTKIPNLFFTGQNINLHGMLGVSISALLTCGEIVGLHEIIREINES